MNTSPVSRRLGWAALLLIPLLAPAGETASLAKATDDDLRIRGVFDSALPRTEKKNSLRLVVHPHLGDLWEHTHLRTALGLRYGLTARWEATTEMDAYFSHGLRHRGHGARLRPCLNRSIQLNYARHTSCVVGKRRVIAQIVAANCGH